MPDRPTIGSLIRSIDDARTIADSLGLSLVAIRLSEALDVLMVDVQGDDDGAVQ
jgi:hypothetical protein